MQYKCLHRICLLCTCQCILNCFYIELHKTGKPTLVYRCIESRVDKWRSYCLTGVHRGKWSYSSTKMIRYLHRLGHPPGIYMASKVVTHLDACMQTCCLVCICTAVVPSCSSWHWVYSNAQVYVRVLIRVLRSCLQ